MKKFLYIITQSELGGAQKYVLDLAGSLKDEFNIVVACGEQGLQGEIAQELSAKKIEVYQIKNLKREISPFKDISALFEILKIIKKTKADIIHLNSSKVSILGSLASGLAKLIFSKHKTVYTAHGWVFNEPLSEAKKKFYKSAEKFSAFFKDIIICVSDFDRTTALKEKIAAEEKLITIHNGIKKIDFLSREESRNILKIKPKEFAIGSIGNLYQNKGYEYLIEAIKIVLKNKKNLKTIIIGDGPEKKSLEKLVKKEGLQDKLILTGRIDAKNLLKAFDLYVCSSVKEGLSYTIIEAMTAGLPIVATKTGGNPELIEDGKNGLLAEIKNPTDLAEKIIFLINNPQAAKKFGLSAKNKAENNFCFEKMAEETKKVYLKLLS